MKCAHCQHDNPADAQFCNHCGQPTSTACPQCGHENPEEARFCNQCGQGLKQAAPASSPAPGSYTPKHLAERILNTRSAIEGERKRVTVLFVDVKGSTELAQQAGDEVWHHILDRFFSILTHGVHRFEGTINQYTGDGIMALFGAPIAHEDHAQRACFAALELQSELRRYADELRLQKGLNLSVRFGLNSGEVVVGRIGDDLRMDYTAKGQTVNLAARMEQIAEPGRIYLTRYTATQVEGYFELRDLGSMPIKGISEPVSVYELESTGRLKTRLDLSRSRGLSRFVGRASEMLLLENALQDVKGGQGQVAAVIGNAGIGKSRLSFEFTEKAQSEGFAIYKGTGVPYASAVPLYPVLGLLRTYFGIEEQDKPAEQRRKIAGTLALTGMDCGDRMQMLFEYLGVAESGATKSAVPPEMRQQELFDLLNEALRGSEKQPVIVMLEDLHWLDPASETFVAEFSESIRDSHTMLLLNYRPEYVSDWLMTAVDIEIPVTALSSAEVGELVGELLGPDDSLSELIGQIREQAGGNPYFVEEAIRNLVELGHLAGISGQYRLVKPVTKSVIPDTVQGILAARIDRLDEDEKVILEYAAVIGKEFQREQLMAVMQREASELSEGLNSLEESGFVHHRETNDELAFCHPLIQEVAYQSQLADRRAEIHARMAEYLQAELGSETFDEKALMLAHHWSKAGEVLKAAQWQINAAVWEGVMRESSGALGRYRQAIELLDTLPSDPTRDKLAIVARSGLLRSSSILLVPREETTRAYEEGLQLAKNTGDHLALAELNIGHASVELQQGDADRAVTQAREAMELARSLGEPSLIARFRIPILLTYFASGRLSEGMDELSEPGAEPWYAGPMTEDNFLSRGFRALMMTYMGQLKEARSELKRAIEIEGEAGRAVSWMHANLVDVARVSGNKDDAMREALAGVSRTERYTSPFFKEVAYRGLAVAHGLNNNWTESVRILEEYLPLVGDGAPAHQFEGIHLAHLAEAYLHLGEIDKANEVILRALESTQKTHSRVWECQVRLVMAAVLCARGEATAAETQLGLLETLITKTGATSFWPFLYLFRSKVTTDTDYRTEMIAKAVAGFAEIGADGWVEQLSRGQGMELGMRAANA